MKEIVTSLLENAGPGPSSGHYYGRISVRNLLRLYDAATENANEVSLERLKLAMDTIHNCFVEYIDGLVWPLRLTRIPYDQHRRNGRIRDLRPT